MWKYKRPGLVGVCSYHSLNIRALFIKMRKKSQEEFIQDAMKIWGNQYDFTKSYYNGNKSPIDVFCNRHGAYFSVSPNNLLRGHGCPLCGMEHRRKLICGIGVNDVFNRINDKAYDHWRDMIRRCYDEKRLGKFPSYKYTRVCDEWLYFSKFKKWFDDNYIDGYHLDKDILFKGNLLYSPDTCCFVPVEINCLLLRRQNSRGEFPIGVYKCGEKYAAGFSIRNHFKRLGLFDSEKDAFIAYKTHKEEYIKSLAQEYFAERKISEKVYMALMRYEVSIDD